MKELVNNICVTMTMTDNEMKKFLEGNKSAGLRARKATLELEKLFKQFRKESVK